MNDNVAPVIDACPRCGHVLSSTSDRGWHNENSKNAVFGVSFLAAVWALGFGANFWIGIALFLTSAFVGNLGLRLLDLRARHAPP